MVSKISQQATPTTGQTGTDALSRNEQGSQTVADKSISTSPPKKLDASYELNLSEAAQAKLASAPAETNTPEKAQLQMNQIRSAMEKSTTSMTNLHKINSQSVLDLLA